MASDLPAHDVLTRFRDVPLGSLVSLGNHGGFSGAQLWRLDTPAGSFALKAWPPGWFTPANLAWIHTLLDQARLLPWIPRMQFAEGGETFVAAHDRLWELASWMPGAADFARDPSPARLHAAMVAVARLHQTWCQTHVRMPSTTVQRRFDAWNEWMKLLQSGWRPQFVPFDPHAAVARELWHLVQLQMAIVPRLLDPWRTRPVPVQPCVADLWHDHILFTGSRVTGIIDFGCVKVDSVAVDLARLVGSLVEEDAPRWEEALAAYASVRSLADEERELMRVLDRVGVVLIAATWLRWLYHEGRVFETSQVVLARLETWLRRLRNQATVDRF